MLIHTELLIALVCVSKDNIQIFFSIIPQISASVELKKSYFLIYNN